MGLYWGEMDPLLDEEVLDLLLVTFNAMDGLLPDEDLKGKINVAKGLEWSRHMGCHDSQLDEECLDSMSARKIWGLRVSRYSFYSVTARNHSDGQWFDYEAWRISRMYGAW